tara:strand:+ start:57 stop:299 length:243 start_codon:yes stop_codon:yes gene_type:complete
MDTQTTAKHIWHNAEQMHKIIEDERKADSGYFDEPPIKKVVIEEGPDGRQKVYYEMPPSQWAIDVLINESRNNQAKRGQF